MLRFGTFAGIVFVSLVGQGFAQGPKAPAPMKVMTKAIETKRLLADQIEIPDVFREQDIEFKDLLKFVSDKCGFKGKDLELIIDKRGFCHVDPEAEDLMDTQIRLPRFVRSMTIQMALEQSLRQSRMEASLVLKNGVVYIVPEKHAKVAFLVDQRIIADLKDVPLQSAIEELAEMAGVTVMIDPRCGAEMKKTVSLRANNDVSLRGVLSSWADNFELKLIVDEHRVYLMPRAEYLKKLRDDAEAAKLQNEIDKARGVEPAKPQPKREGEEPATKKSSADDKARREAECKKQPPWPARRTEVAEEPKEPAAKPRAAATRGASLRKFLAETVEIPVAHRHQDVEMSDFVMDFVEKLQLLERDCSLFIDERAFADENLDGPFFEETQIRFQPFARTMTRRQALDVAVNSFSGEADFVLKRGHIVVAPPRFARIGFLIDRRVFADFRETPLEVAVQELADQAGVTVIVDSRCGPAMKRAVTFRANKDDTLRGVLTAWAELYDLKLLVDEHRISLMPQAEYLKKARLEAEEATLRQPIPQAPERLSRWRKDAPK